MLVKANERRPYSRPSPLSSYSRKPPSRPAHTLRTSGSAAARFRGGGTPGWARRPRCARRRGSVPAAPRGASTAGPRWRSPVKPVDPGPGREPDGLARGARRRPPPERPASTGPACTGGHGGRRRRGRASAGTSARAIGHPAVVGAARERVEERDQPAAQAQELGGHPLGLAGVLPRQAVAVVGVQPVDRLERPELDPAHVHVVGQVPALEAADVVAHVGQADRALGGGQPRLEVEHLPRRAAVAREVHGVAVLGERAGLAVAEVVEVATSRCARTPASACRAPRLRARVELVDPGVLGQPRRLRARLVAAPVEPPEVEPLALERLVQAEVGVEVARIGPVEHRAALHRVGHEEVAAGRRRRLPRMASARPTGAAASSQWASRSPIEGWMFSASATPSRCEPVDEAHGSGYRPRFQSQPFQEYGSVGSIPR